MPRELRGFPSAALWLALTEGQSARLPCLAPASLRWPNTSWCSSETRCGRDAAPLWASHGAVRQTRHAHLALRLPRAPQSVGKTSIITRFVYDKFDAQYQVRVLGPPQQRRPAARRALS